MKKAWNKASRVISALLVLGMFASVVPAQALAVDEPDSQVTEQQDEEQTVEEASSGEVATNDLQEEKTQEDGEPELLSAGEDRFANNGLWLDYTIVNKSKNVSVKYVYAYSNAFPVQEDVLEPGDAFTKYICPLNGTSTIMFFFKVPTGYTFDAKFTSDAKGRVEPLTEIDSQPGNKWVAHDFR